MDTALKMYGKYEVRGVKDMNAEIVKIPEGVLTIGTNAFEDCKKLTQIDIPNSVKEIRGHAFDGCKSLTHLEIPDSVEDIQCGAFARCTSLKEVVLPLSLNKLVKDVFYGCTSLRKVTIKENLKYIDWSAFYGCSQIKEYVISDQNNKFCSENGIVYNKKKTILYKVPAKIQAKEFVVKDGVQKIQIGAFNCCKKIKHIVFPSSITEICEGAFRNCSLEEVTIPESVTALGKDVFADCVSLKKIYIPASVKRISKFAFMGCTSLEQIEVASGAKFYVSADGILHKMDTDRIIGAESDKKPSAFVASDTIKEDEQQTEELPFRDMLQYSEDASVITGVKKQFLLYVYHAEIPEGIKEIGVGAFRGCENLMSVSFPSTLEFIHDNAFRGCKQLKSLNLPEGLKEIGRWSFEDCSAIESVSLPSTLECIQGAAFRDCKQLKSLVLPEGLKEIGINAFKGCSALEELVLPHNLKVIGSGIIDGTTISHIFIPASVEKISPEAFFSDKLTEITVDKDNPYYAFREGVLYNKDFTKLLCVLVGRPMPNFSIPAGVVSVSAEAFHNCNSIKTLSINDDIADFPIEIFTNTLPQFENIEVGPNNKLFKLVDGVLLSKDGKRLIRMCLNSQSEKYVVPESVTVIEDGAFRGCDKIESFTIHEHVSSIGKNVFEGCTGIKELHVKCPVINLNRDVFDGIIRGKCHLYTWENSLGFLFYREAFNHFIIHTY